MTSERDPEVVFSAGILGRLASDVAASARGRLSLDLHASHAEACQRLFNAMELDSYLRPHRHHDPDLATRLGQAARAKALAEFDEKIVIERTMAVYRELLPAP